MGRLVNFFRNQDQLGSGVSFNYKGSAQYGTIVGGCFSLCTTIFFVAFIGVQMYAWLFKPSYNEEISVGYLPRKSPTPYEVPLTLFLPTFTVITNYAAEDESDMIFNDLDLFAIEFYQFQEGELKEIPLIKCEYLIGNMTDLSAAEKEQILDELLLSEYMLCPNTTSFFVEGGTTGDQQTSVVIYAGTETVESDQVNKTAIYSAEIVRYFTPEDYSENGYQSAITLTEDVIYPVAKTTQNTMKLISQSEISFYDFRFLDTSAFTLFDLGSKIFNYRVETESKYVQPDLFASAEGYYTLATIDYAQSRVQNKFTWSVASLDIVLGLVGGLSGIIWGTLLLVFGSYESFKFENSLIGGVYPTSPSAASDGDDDNSPSSEREAKKAMMQSVSERGKYWYTYSEYLATSLLKLCCCCCADSAWYKRREKRLERHLEASEKLANEIDICKLLYVQRVGQFIAKLILNKHQRALVTSFKKYQVEDLCHQPGEQMPSTADPEAALLAPTIQEEGTSFADFKPEDLAGFEHLTEEQLKLLLEISANFAPDDSAADLGILYEVTGYQGESQNFQFWDNYQDFDELGGTKLVRQDRDEQLLASTRNATKTKVTFDTANDDT